METRIVILEQTDGTYLKATVSWDQSVLPQVIFHDGSVYARPEYPATPLERQFGRTVYHRVTTSFTVSVEPITPGDPS